METTTQYLKRVQAGREATAARLAENAKDTPQGSPEREHAAIFMALNRRATKKARKGTVTAMTDAEINRLTERCAAGDPTALEDYERVTRAAIRRLNRCRRS